MSWFDLTEDQRLLCDSLDRLLADHYGIAERRRIAAEPNGWSPSMWRRFAELGLLAAPFPESAGGLGGSPVDTLLVMAAFGRSLVLEPYLASIILAGGAIGASGDGAAVRRLLPSLADGSLVAAFAHAEPGARSSQWFVETGAARDGARWLLRGAKSGVLAGGSAQLLVVTARVHGPAESADGLGLFLVEKQAPGLSCTRRTLHDGSQTADLVLHDAPAAALGVPGEAGAAIGRVLQAGIAASLAEAAGAMETLLTLTVDYLKTREQFGRKIGANQALQHRAVDMLVATEQARSMALLATDLLDEPDAAARARGLAQAKVIVGRSSRLAAHVAVQLHGGIGMAEEYAAGLYFRRLMVLEQLFGDPAYHLRVLADEVARR